MKKIRPALIIRIVGACLAALDKVVDATKADSDGGKKITTSEAEDIWAAFASHLRPEFLRILKVDES